MPARARAAIRWKVMTESSVATLIPTTSGRSRIACERGVVVGHAARGLVQLEGDDRQLPAEPLVIADGILRGGKGEQRVGPAPAGLDGHGDVARAGDDARGRAAPRARSPAPHARCSALRCGPRPVWAQTATPAIGCAAIQRGIAALGRRRRARCRGTARAPPGTRPHSSRARQLRRRPSSLDAALPSRSALSALDRGAVAPASRSSRSSLATPFSGNPERLAGAEHEPLGADRAEQRLQVILRRPPDPADVPPDAAAPPPASSRSAPPR